METLCPARILLHTNLLLISACYVTPSPLLSFIPATELVADLTAQRLLAQLNVRIAGVGPTTLLFCNGFNCEQNIWRMLTPTLATQYQLVLFDQVGVGQSDRTVAHSPRYATLDGYVQDVLGICQALALPEVVLVGHSAGALVAMLAAVQAPARVAKLILLAASPCFLNFPDYYGGFDPSDLHAVLAEMNANYQAWANTFATMLIGQYHAPELSHELVNCASQADPEMAKRVVQQTFLGDYRAQVPHLACSTLLLQCTNDPAVPEEVNAYWLAHLPQASLRTLPTEGHCPHLTAPAEVLEAMQQFLAPA